jgi:hypothetical protein
LTFDSVKIVPIRPPGTQNKALAAINLVVNISRKATQLPDYIADFAVYIRKRLKIALDSQYLKYYSSLNTVRHWVTRSFLGASHAHH